MMNQSSAIMAWTCASTLPLDRYAGLSCPVSMAMPTARMFQHEISSCRYVAPQCVQASILRSLVVIDKRGCPLEPSSAMAAASLVSMTLSSLAVRACSACAHLKHTLEVLNSSTAITGLRRPNALMSPFVEQGGCPLQCCTDDLPNSMRCGSHLLQIRRASLSICCLL